MSQTTIAVTGVSGMLGQRLLPLLDVHPEVARIVGLDVRDPARRVGKLTMHRVDVRGSELKHVLEGVDVVVHLATLRDPIPDTDLMERVNVEGTRRLLDAASAMGVTRIVRVSSASVYGAWPDNPVPLTEDAPLRPSPGFLPAMHDAECERLLAEWEAETPGSSTAILRVAPIVGPTAMSLLARCAIGRAPVIVRDAARPVQVVHVDDAASALALVVTEGLTGVYNVAADSWLEAGDAAELSGTRRLPGLPVPVAERMLRGLWASGLGDAPPSILPYLLHPWVIANDRIVSAGFVARQTNEEAIVLASPGAATGPSVGWIAATGAILVGALGATLWSRRRRRRRRSRRRRAA